MSLYELAILGEPSPDDRTALVRTLEEMVANFGLEIGREVVIHDDQSIVHRDARAAFAATYFASRAHRDVAVAQSLAQASAPIIPTIGPQDSFQRDIPAFLQPYNGLQRRQNDPHLAELAAAMLECVGLLRRQRRVFVSYRRTESKSAAMQMHDLLASRGFDVFLDTHDIRPGDPFQDILWHRLCDSDVLVMLDTPTYFDSKWTRQEIGRARAKEISVLRVVWPDHTPSRFTGMAETMYLKVEDLEGQDGPITSQKSDEIVIQVERVRSRSIASRYLSITGKFRSDVQRIGGEIEGIGAHRAISVRLINQDVIWAYPIVGIPTADLLHDVADKAARGGQVGRPILIYDHLGIRDTWAEHLKWLDEHIQVVKAIKVSDVSWILSGEN